MALQLVRIEPTIAHMVGNISEYLGNPIVDGQFPQCMRIEDITDFEKGSLLEWFNPAGASLEMRQYQFLFPKKRSSSPSQATMNIEVRNDEVIV
ncbi:hypothetical protein MMC27_005177 [Xylographa pallens]|nr:hypothetical protein [Xylographa pallens]